MLIQFRTIDGATHEEECELNDAIVRLVDLGGHIQKISFNGPEPYSRFIIYSDRTWEYRTPESIRKMALGTST